MDTLAIWGRPPRLDSPVRLSDSPSVCLSACVTDAILCHTYEQSTESRWANKFITCLNALTIHSVRTDVCVCVSVDVGVGTDVCSVCAGCICFLLKDFHTYSYWIWVYRPDNHINIYIHPCTHTQLHRAVLLARQWTFLYNSWNAHHSHNRNYDCHSAMCLKVGQDNAYAQSTLPVILAV